jgi:hypothetical protein
MEMGRCEVEDKKDEVVVRLGAQCVQTCVSSHKKMYAIDRVVCH